MKILKRIKNGKPLLFEEDKNIIHPATGQLIKKGDFQYWIGDDRMADMLISHMGKEFEQAEIKSIPKTKETTVTVKVIEPTVDVEVILPTVDVEVILPTPSEMNNIDLKKASDIWKMNTDSLKEYAASHGVDSKGTKKIVYERIKEAKKHL